MKWRIAVAMIGLASLSGCFHHARGDAAVESTEPCAADDDAKKSQPQPGRYADDNDSTPTGPPPDLSKIPEPVPKTEPKSQYGNKSPVSGARRNVHGVAVVRRLRRARARIVVRQQVPRLHDLELRKIRHVRLHRGEQDAAAAVLCDGHQSRERQKRDRARERSRTVRAEPHRRSVVRRGGEARRVAERNGDGRGAWHRSGSSGAAAVACAREHRRRTATENAEAAGYICRSAPSRMRAMPSGLPVRFALRNSATCGLSNRPSTENRCAACGWVRCAMPTKRTASRRNCAASASASRAWRSIRMAVATSSVF